MNAQERQEYEEKRKREEETHYKVKRCVCAECGSRLRAPYDPELGEVVLICGSNRTHKGAKKPMSYTEAWRQGIPVPIHIENIIQKKEERQMTEELGAEATKALIPYRSVTTLTRQSAELIVSTLWPEAPAEERMAAVMVCCQYGLNPLMNHIHLMSFYDSKTGTKKWKRVLGISATRLIASRKEGGYGYVDGPRMMTEAEQKSIRGEVDPDNIWAITTLRDKDGNQAPGYGNWPKRDTDNKGNPLVKGTDKGNTKQNMAMVRSERNAFDRLRPGEMPQGGEVMDSQYMTLNDRQTVIPETGEIVEGESREITEHWCPLHNCAFTEKTGKDGATFWSHPKAGGGWCNEKGVKKTREEPEGSAEEPEEPPEATSESPEETPVDFKNPGELLTYWRNKRGKSSEEILAHLNVDSSTQIKDLAQAAQTLKAHFG